MGAGGFEQVKLPHLYVKAFKIYRNQAVFRNIHPISKVFMRTLMRVKVGCKVGYFCPLGAYSDKASKTASAAASARPATAWLYQP